MKYLIWQDNDDKDDDNHKILNVLFTNHSFAEIFEGENPLHPVGEIIKMHHKRYKIIQFQKMEEMIEVKVDLIKKGVSETA